MSLLKTTDENAQKDPSGQITPGVGQRNTGPAAAPYNPLAGGITQNANGTPVNNYSDIVNNDPTLKNTTPEFRQWVQRELQNNTLSPTNLLPGQRNLDDQTQGLISDQLGRASQSNDQVTGQLMKGAEDARGLMASPDEMQRHATAMGGGNDATDTLQHALSNRNNDHFNDSLEGLRRNAAFAAPQIQANRQKQVSGELSQNEQLKLKNYSEQQQYMQQKRSMDLQLAQAKQQGRAAAISSIFAAGGTVAGAVVGGAPGAAAGAAGGAAAGNQVAGATA